MSNNTKLELTWIGKENHPKLEPRILLEDTEKSHHVLKRISKKEVFDNSLIFGDNLLALKALEQEYTGKVKCIYIDPPYNTGNAFEHYDDGVEHSIWLNLMRDRLVILSKMLMSSGTFWINLDDNESHYCKIMCDEIFGRQNFLGNVVWEKADSPRMDAVFFSTRHDHILVYAKDKINVVFNRLNSTASHYNKIDKMGRSYYLKPLRAMGGQGETRISRPTLYYSIFAPDGTEVFPVKQDGEDGAWRWSKEKVEVENERIEWVNGRKGWSPYYRIYADTSNGRPAETIWYQEEVGSNRTSKAEIKALFPDSNVFSTPKPEGLLERVLTIATNPGDLVLDSFAGSGTTGAVAHKMGRRWIMIELGEHCHTHIIPRLKKVIDGQDPGGITEAVGWKGGGGFRYYKLAPSLLQKDKWGNWIINKEYRPEMLAEAVCKLEGFTYEPSDSVYWIHGHSTETDYIYITTQILTREQMQLLADEVGDKRTLLIMCSAFKGKAADFPNLTIKKIPNTVLTKCEWGHDDYSLQVENLPMAEKPKKAQQDLFEEEEGD